MVDPTDQTAAMKVFDWAFRDRSTGRIVIAQWPNVPLAIWIAASVLRALIDPADTTPYDVVAGLALTWWSVDEIVRGVNPWRRFLGAVVLTGLVLSLFR
jgi:hypothetical protein